MATYEELLEIIKAQQKTIEKLTAELEAAREEIAELKEKLNKDSHNSSKPPSTDGYEKPAPRSQRKKSGKKAGGQTGHKGHHIDLGQPNRVERIYPQHCANCPHREYCTHALSEKRGKEAMEKIGFLTEYTGIVVHDFWMPYFKVTKAEHAMCCAH
ncbi:MAG: DUF6444 domain-containing protein, partial [Oscillospiraceae bacterium]